MSRKQLLARLYVDTSPWHSADGWFCEEEGVECGASEDTLCPCCVINLDRLASEQIASGGAL